MNFHFKHGLPTITSFFKSRNKTTTTADSEADNDHDDELEQILLRQNSTP